MAKYDDAVNDLVWLEKKLSGLFSIVPQLKDLSTLESAVSALQAQKDLLQKESASLAGDVLAAKDALKAQAKDQDVVVLAQKKKIDSMLAAAEEKANTIVSEATSSANRTAAHAETEARRFAAEAVEAKKRLDSVLAEVAEKQKVLDDLNTRLQKLKESL